MDRKQREAVQFAIKMHEYMDAASNGTADFVPVWITDPGISSISADLWPSMYRFLAEQRRTCKCCGGAGWHVVPFTYSNPNLTVDQLSGLTLMKCGDCDENGMSLYICEN